MTSCKKLSCERKKTTKFKKKNGNVRVQFLLKIKLLKQAFKESYFPIGPENPRIPFQFFQKVAELFAIQGA
jgi:hypothetical protein